MGGVGWVDPEGSLPDSDAEASGQLQPASALQTVRAGLEWTAWGTQAEMSSWDAKHVCHRPLSLSLSTPTSVTMVMNVSDRVKAGPLGSVRPERTR